MKRNSMMARRATMSAFIVAATVATTGVVTTASFAQPPAGGGGGFGGGGGQRGGGQRGGQQLTVGSVPSSALAVGLKLTDDQKTKIDTAEKPMMDMMKSMMQPGAARPDREKMTAARTQADTDVTAVLTDDQKAALPALLKKLGEMQRAGIPVGVYGDLKLSSDQETQILDVAEKAQRKMREAMQAQQDSGAQPDRQAMMTMYQDAQKDTKTKVEAVLTASQKTTLDEYVKAHPQRGFGGAGGGGRRGGGGAAGGGAAAGGGNL